MGIFDKFKTSIAIDRLSEEKLYEQVGQELKAGKKREGIWVKAMAKSGGDLNKAESMYIDLRVQAFKDEVNLDLAQKELNKKLKDEEKINDGLTLEDAKNKVQGTDFIVRRPFFHKVYIVDEYHIGPVFFTGDLTKLHKWLDENINDKKRRRTRVEVDLYRR
jgi:hypothetical protein